MKESKLFVSIAHVTNAFGKVHVQISMAHDYGCVVLIDLSPKFSSFKIDVQELDCDFCNLRT